MVRAPASKHLQEVAAEVRASLNTYSTGLHARSC